MSDDGGVRITLRDVYDEVQKMNALLTPLVDPRVGVVVTQEDHEVRIRKMEQRLYAIPGAGVLIGLAGVGVAIFVR